MGRVLRQEDFTAPGWIGALCNTWGATSLHAEVFRKPDGFRWVHCARCRLPAPPASQWRYCPFVPSVSKIAERVYGIAASAYEVGPPLPSPPLTIKRMTEILAREFAKTCLP